MYSWTEKERFNSGTIPTSSRNISMYRPASHNSPLRSEIAVHAVHHRITLLLGLVVLLLIVAG